MKDVETAGNAKISATDEKEEAAATAPNTAGPKVSFAPTVGRPASKNKVSTFFLRDLFLFTDEWVEIGNTGSSRHNKIRPFKTDPFDPRSHFPSSDHQYWNHWACCAWKIHRGESHIWRSNNPI
jgi:hypothetical protein